MRLRRGEGAAGHAKPGVASDAIAIVLRLGVGRGARSPL